jgi:hypothetical protein
MIFHEKLAVFQLVNKSPELWKPKVQYRVHKSPPFVHMLGELIQSRPINLTAIIFFEYYSPIYS